jgi:2-polyprenyl-3-methyl-5-hydroxy-6-metoxy-1,4-benzoquinol methylase
MKTEQNIYQNYHSETQHIDVQEADKLQSPYLHKVYKKHFAILNRNINILEIGCGSGSFILYLQKQGFNNISGIDLSEEQVNLAHSRGLKEIINGDALAFINECSDKTYDLVIAMDVIEHIKKEELIPLISGIQRILTNEGMLLTHQPNAEGLFGNGIIYGDLTHQQGFTRASLNQLFLHCGFKTMAFYEDKPTVHGLKSLLRRFFWSFLIRPLVLFAVAVEKGFLDRNYICSSGFLSKAIK